MGCISSKKQISEMRANVFQVMNVDEHGNRINPGQLEITELDLVLYQRGKPPIKWPLRTLRRYGFDSEHFSFESGRRCQTGPGIYAFRCRRAEQLFNLLQSRIQIRNNGDAADAMENTPATGVARDTGYLEPTTLRRTNPGSRFSSQNGMQRLSSVASTSGSIGPLSPQSGASQPFPLEATLTPIPVSRPLSQNLYANEEVIASVLQSKEETNNNKSPDELSLPQVSNYTNATAIELLPPADSPIEIQKEEEIEALSAVPGGHLYMNIVPGTGQVGSRSSTSPQPSTSSASALDRDSDEKTHSYANFEKDAACSITSPPSPATKNLNYIVLDLEPSSEPSKSPTGSAPPDSPRKPTGGYAAIDFKKTVALSHSVNPIFDNDSEGTRKTRHNSNINDLLGHTRNSSSVSD